MEKPGRFQPHNQPNAYLLNLPLELRLSIYTHIISPITPNTILHIPENDKVKTIPCSAPPETSPGIQHRPTSDPQRLYESIHRSCGVRRGRSWETPEKFWNVKSTDIKTSLAGLRGLILSCRGLYSEGTNLLYERIVFELSALPTTHKFLTLHISLENIQNLDIGWAVRGFCTYQRLGYEDQIPEEYNSENHNQWIEICGAIEKMRNLTFLRIRLYRTWGMRLVERELLEPLMGPGPGVGVGMEIERERFVVELPKIMATDRKEHLVDEELSESTRFRIVRV